jgi:hypothetical protein
MFHYPAATGNHWCVRDVYDHAVVALAGLAAVHQQAIPEPAREQLISREGIVRGIEEKIQTSTEETDFGTDAQLPDIRRNG